MTYAQEYYQKNKERLLKYVNVKTKCECGKVIARINLAKHRRTGLHERNMRHLEYLQSIEDE